MASILNPQFNWGDSVMIVSTAPSYFKPNVLGSICGTRIIENEDTAKQFNQVIGSELYLIEFGNGETLEIPRNFLNRTE